MPNGLAIVVSHPIQYYAPWFRYLAQRMAIEVFYAHQQTATGQSEAGFGVEFDWDVPLVEGYAFRWLKNVARRPGVNSFWGCDTPEVYDILRTGRFDACLVFGWNRKSALQAIRACWKYRVPVLMRGDSQLPASRSRIKRVVKYLPYRWFLRRLDGHLYVGARNRNYLEHYDVPEERLFFAPHFVDNDLFCGGTEAATRSGAHLKVREMFGVSPDAFVVLFVGKLISKKRPDDLVRACLRILQLSRDADVHAIVIGDGPLRQQLLISARDHENRVHFAGFRNQHELSAFYAASNVLVLPSGGDETWGLVVNEAMACGVPAIVSDAVGCGPDLIEEGQTGYTYPVGNVPELADRILRLKLDCETAGQSIRSALAQKTERYSMRKATEGLLSALDTIVVRRQGRLHKTTALLNV